MGINIQVFLFRLLYFRQASDSARHIFGVVPSNGSNKTMEGDVSGIIEAFAHSAV